MFGFLEGVDLVIVAVIVLVLFGGSKLPQLARSLGEAQHELKKAMSDSDDHQSSSTAKQPPAQPGSRATTTEPHPGTPLDRDGNGEATDAAG